MSAVSVIALVPEDTLLRSLGRAAWRALPVLAACGTAAAGLAALAFWIGLRMPGFVPLIAVVLVAPLLAVSIDAVQRHLFEEPTAVHRARRVLVPAIGCAVPAAFAVGSTVLGVLADSNGSWPLQVLAVAAVGAAVVAALVAVVALPVAAWRADVSVRSVVVFSLVAVVRRPLGAVAALLAAAAVVWLGLTWFAGLLILVVPVLTVLMVGAAWPTASASGVRLPALVPVGRPPSGGEQ
ncbi:MULTISPECIES: hypothetical protein [unclassified Microbacterium]|uniref:hypothetical protein n=1 Tax=unclassified Microbacterium TaxID=2609290 RepID=UPI003010281F